MTQSSTLYTLKGTDAEGNVVSLGTFSDVDWARRAKGEQLASGKYTDITIEILVGR